MTEIENMTFLLILDMVCIFYHSYLCDCQSFDYLPLCYWVLSCLARQFCFTSMKWETETSLCVKVSCFPFYFYLNFVLKTTFFFALFGYKCQFGLINIVSELPLAQLFGRCHSSRRRSANDVLKSKSRDYTFRAFTNFIYHKTFKSLHTFILEYFCKTTQLFIKWDYLPY